MDDPRPQFLAAATVSHSRVVDLPRLIFLCGGPIPANQKANATLLGYLASKISAKWPWPASISYLSARHYTRDYLKESHPNIAKRIRMADDIRRWSENGVYTDLVTFETHLAALADVVVVFVESAGSIAELGAFSHLAEVRTKVLAFVQNSRYDDTRSYIKLGPLAFLEQQDDQSVNAYPWEVTKKSNQLRVSSIRSDIESIAANIVNRAERPHFEETFEPNRIAHRLLLTYDLVCLMFALTRDEVHKCLEGVGMICNKREVEQFLFILERLGFIVEQKYGHTQYFVPKMDGKFIRYKFRASHVPFRRMAFQQTINEYYRSEDPNRIKAINRATKRNLGA